MVDFAFKHKLVLAWHEEIKFDPRLALKVASLGARVIKCNGIWRLSHKFNFHEADDVSLFVDAVREARKSAHRNYYTERSHVSVWKHLSGFFIASLFLNI